MILQNTFKALKEYNKEIYKITQNKFDLAIAQFAEELKNLFEKYEQIEHIGFNIEEEYSDDGEQTYYPEINFYDKNHNRLEDIEIEEDELSEYLLDILNLILYLPHSLVLYGEIKVNRSYENIEKQLRRYL